MRKYNKKPKLPPKDTAVIYARFSCSKQREASIEDQLRVCEEWCQRNGFVVVERYCDRAISGRTDDRPSFQAMIENAGEAAIVLVYMMDRFSRDPYDAPLYKSKLAAKGVRVVSATEAMPDGPESILIEKVYEGIAAVESAHISMRTKRGMSGNAAKCMHNGVSCFGYDLGKDGYYHVNEREAAIVREVFERCASGESKSSIGRDLARRGVRNFQHKLATPSMVGCMVRNEKYTGVYKYGDVRVEGGMPAIISKEEYNLAQLVRGRRTEKRPEHWRFYPLSGKAFCAKCGSSLQGVSGKNHNGTRYDYYRCSHKCWRMLRADWVEEALVDGVRAMLSDRRCALDIADLVAEGYHDKTREAQIDAALADIRDAEKGINNIVDAIASGIDAGIVKSKLDALKEKKEQAEEQLSKLQVSAEFEREDFANFLQYGATLTDEKILVAFVHQVLVDDDMVTATLNYGIKKFEPVKDKYLNEVRTFNVWLPRTFELQAGKQEVRVGIVSNPPTVALRFSRY